MARLSTSASTLQSRNYSPGSACYPRRRTWRAVLAGVVLLFAGPPAVLANTDVEALLARAEAPHGVVFEIVEADEAALDELLPRVRAAINSIRERFPQAEFAVVSHGREEFALQRQYRDDYAGIHRQVEALVAEEVPVHVCETHAGWYGVSADDFPDYVNVAPTGPGQVQLYLELGYELVVMESYD